MGLRCSVSDNLHRAYDRRTGLAQAGDFGRPKPSLLEGLIPKQFWQGPVTGYSVYPLTDLEEELRDRSYVLIRPNEPRGKWNIYIAGFQIAHLLPPSMTDYDTTEYGRMLLWTLARSEASSYNRLIEDMASDGALVEPVRRDRLHGRTISTSSVSAASPMSTSSPRARPQMRSDACSENRMVTAWVHRALHWRIASYRYALERLVIAVPSRLAVEAERMLKHFERIVLQADPALTTCSGVEFAAVPIAGRAPIVSK